MLINASEHLSDETLERYAMGQLPTESVPPFEEHVFLCEHCQVRLDQAEEYIQVVANASKQLQKDVAPKSAERFNKDGWSWLWSLPKPVWAGATAMVMLTMVSVGVRNSQDRESPISSEVVLSTSNRGLEEALLANARPGQLVLKLNAAEVPPAPSYRVQVVAVSGAEIWNGPAKAEQGQIQVAMPHSVKAGKYWVRLYGPAGDDLLQEYGLAVR